MMYITVGLLALFCVAATSAQSIFDGGSLFDGGNRGKNSGLSFGNLFGNNRRNTGGTNNRNRNRGRNNNNGGLFEDRFSDMFGASLLDENRNREAFREGIIFGDRGVAREASNKEFRFKDNDDERFKLEENSEEYLEFDSEDRNADKSYFAMNVVDENESRSESANSLKSGRQRNNGVSYEQDKDIEAENIEQSQSEVETETEFETEVQDENESETILQAREEAETIAETLSDI